MWAKVCRHLMILHNYVDHIDYFAYFNYIDYFAEGSVKKSQEGLSEFASEDK